MMGLKKLSERIDINTWKEIANRVQKLNIYEFTDEEFYDNLEMLRLMLIDLGISLDFLSRYPSNIDEIGLASLLQAIYLGNGEKDYKKANFYEKIYQLDELGVSWIEFRPSDFPLKVEGIALLKDNNGAVIGINKCFTDGEFNIGYSDEPFDRWYDLINLKNANYLINVLLGVDIECNNEFGCINDAGAVLRNFKGEYPSKESIFEICYPGLCMYPEDVIDDRRHYVLKQVYFKFDIRDSKYGKRLVRTPNNYHYE